MNTKCEKKMLNRQIINVIVKRRKAVEDISVLPSTILYSENKDGDCYYSHNKRRYFNQTKYRPCSIKNYQKA
jgi:hypothetical protein